jgi:hypothetical protein
MQLMRVMNADTPGLSSFDWSVALSLIDYSAIETRLGVGSRSSSARCIVQWHGRASCLQRFV